MYTYEDKTEDMEAMSVARAATYSAISCGRVSQPMLTWSLNCENGQMHPDAHTTDKCLVGKTMHRICWGKEPAAAARTATFSQADNGMITCTAFEVL